MAPHGYSFQDLDVRHRNRFHKLVKEHSHTVNAAASSISALPGVVTPYAATLAMHRFLKQEKLPSHALIEPAQDAATRRTSATNSARPCWSTPGTAAPRVRCPDRSRDRDHPAGVA